MTSTSEARGVLADALDLIAAGYTVSAAINRLVLAAHSNSVVPTIEDYSAIARRLRELKATASKGGEERRHFALSPARDR